MKKIKILLAAGFMGIALTGCGMNAEKLVDEMAAATEGKQMTQATTTMEMDMSMEAEGVSMDMSMDMVMDIQASNDPYASYTNMETTVDVAGQQTSEVIQLYSIEEDGALVNYVYTESTDSWEKQDLGMSMDDIASQTADYNWLLEKAKSEELTLEEDTQTVNGKEVYVTNCTLEGEEIQKAFEGIGSMTDMFEQAGMGEIDFTALSVPTTYYIDKETFLPVKMEMDIEGMDEMMDELLANMFAQAEMETELNFSISKLHAVL